MKQHLLKAIPVTVGLLVAGNAAQAFPESGTYSNVMMQQNVTIKGTIVDSTGSPLIGVNILEAGTTNGTISDFDGNFSLNVKPNAALTISYIGYETITVHAKNDGKPLKIVLKEDSKALDEVVVVGYGTVRKADLAGSVAVLDNKNFKDQPITSASDALQGRVSGVSVENSGIPGGSVKIRVRGANSINTSNDPLYVVDGIVRESGLDGINPEDIQSMQVLKDASSTAIYGARGANGVVLITTKTGKEGRMQVTLDASLGISSLAKRYDLMNAQEYAKALQEVKGTSSEELKPYLNGSAGIDWQDQMFRTGVTQNYKVAFTGGNDKTQYYVSGNFMDQEGIVIETNNKRYSAKVNVTSQITDWLHLTADVNASHAQRHGGEFGYNKSNVIWRTLNYSPTMEMMDAAGNYNKDPYNVISENPYGMMQYTGESMTNVFNGRVDLKFNLAKGLTFTTTNGVDYYDGKDYNFGSTKVYTKSSMGNNDTYRMMLQSSNNLTYMGNWGNHHLTATGVFETTSSETRQMGITGNNLQTESVTWWNVGLASSRDASNAYSKWTLMSGLARVMYNYGDRYLVTGTLRADGSSRFVKDKWGYFPSLALAWTVSNEDFMKDVTAVQDLKLRASYGLVGNQNIGVYSTLGMMTSTGYNFGTQGNYTGYWATDTPTPDVTWEKTRQFNIGADFSLLNRRVNVSVDYFTKLTYDALLRKNKPNYQGGGSYWVNQGEISNKGIDFTISAMLASTKDFSWNSTLNGTIIKTKVNKLAGGDNDFMYAGTVGGFTTDATIIKPGEALGSFFGYEWAGIDKDGRDTYYDKDNKVVTAPSGDDRRIIGKATPDLTMGWNNSLRYKNWDLNLFFNSSFGAKRLNLVRFTAASMVGDSRFITLKEAYDKQGSEFPLLSVTGNSYQPISTKWLEDASFVRLENISLSYNLSREITKFADFRFTLSCQNLFTITGYKGMDPAGSSFSGDNVDTVAGIDMGAYPTPRTTTFTVRMTF